MTAPLPVIPPGPPGDRPPKTPREDADDAAEQAGPLADAPVPEAQATGGARALGD